MGKLPSTETQLRHAKAALAREKRVNDSLRVEATRNLNRAIAAEKELAEWKARFDILLRREDPDFNGKLK